MEPYVFLQPLAEVFVAGGSVGSLKATEKFTSGICDTPSLT